MAAATVIATPLAMWALLSSRHPSGSKYALVSLGLLNALAFIASGVVARTWRPDNRTGLLMIAVGFGWYLSALGQANNPYVFTFGTVAGAITLGTLIHLIVAFPSGRLESRFARFAVSAGYALVIGVNLVSVLFSDLRSSCGANCPRNVALVYHDESLARTLVAVAAVFAVALAVAIVWLLVVRWRNATTAMRRALLPVFIAGCATFTAAAIDLAATSAHHGAVGAAWLLFAVFLGVPLAFLFGLLRSRLAGGAVARLLVTEDAGEETEARLRDALRDPGLRLGFWYPPGASYVDAEGAPLDLRVGDGRHLTELRDEAGSAFAAVLHDVALLEDPHLLDSALGAARLGLRRDRLQAELRARVADLLRERNFFSTVANAIPTLLVGVEPNGRVHAKGGNRAFELGAGYSDTDAVGEYLWDLVGAEADLREGIAESVESNSGSAERESVWTTRDGRELTVLWTCTPLPYGEHEAPVYAVAALDISARKAAEVQLRQSRARIVAAAAAERRRLERNLHDGAQQRLVSVALTLRLAQTKLDTDPDASRQMLDGAATELTAALAELRELARGLHPAGLTERGLEAAIRALAERAPVAVEIDVDLNRRLPEPVEVAVFYVVSESLTNVAKYAQAQFAQVRIAAQNGRVEAVVHDDGVGGAALDGGTGLTGLADRIEALDGTFSVESPRGGGTTVTATVPVAP